MRCCAWPPNARWRDTARQSESLANRASVNRECASNSPAPATLRTARSLDTGGISYRRGAAYLGLIGLPKSQFGIEADDDIDQINIKIRDGVAEAELDGDDLDAMFALLDIPVKDPGWHELLPQQRRHRVFDALNRLFARLANQAPLILIFEDLHWMDEESIAFVNALASSIADQ